MVNVSPPDAEYIGDLASLRPLSTKPRIRRFINGKDGFVANDDFKSGIEAKINEFFADKGWALLPEWKNSAMWKNFEYVVALVGEASNANAVNKVYDSIVGLLVAFTIETPSGFKFRYYDKIGIREDERGNGYMPNLVKEARKIDLGLDEEREPKRQHPTPAGLRTSESENDKRYKIISDYRIIYPGANGRMPNHYFVHLFGIKDKDKKPIKPYMDRMYETAEHIGNLPSTFKKAAQLK